jgi:cytochrome c biogenesis factor
MSIRRVRLWVGLAAFVLGLALVLSSLLFPWVSADLGTVSKSIVRKGHEVAPYAPLLAAGLALIGVIQARVRGSRDLAWISLFTAAVAVLLFAAFMADRAYQRDQEFMGMSNIPVKVLRLSCGYYMFLAAGIFFGLAGYAEYSAKDDVRRRRKKRTHR